MGAFVLGAFVLGDWSGDIIVLLGIEARLNDAALVPAGESPKGITSV
jgi:hypothetical protein